MELPWVLRIGQPCKTFNSTELKDFADGIRKTGDVSRSHANDADQIRSRTASWKPWNQMRANHKYGTTVVGIVRRARSAGTTLTLRSKRIGGSKGMGPKTVKTNREGSIV
ncbi:MAG: hypothetical protein MMC33_005914 [Icmadophila ericetorum]|nr:hypothetical protein [Icmadophila ericetorum]